MPPKFTTDLKVIAPLTSLVHIVLTYSPAPRVVHEFALQVASGTTVAQAIAQWQASTPVHDLPADIGKRRHGIWGKPVKPGQVLKDADRIEIYRPLKVDPKTARRERFAKQGSKGTGLFAQSRVGGKQGY